MKKVFISVLAAMTVGCSAGNLDEVKAASEAVWDAQGFEVVAYEGYEWGFWGFNSYGGAKVWHRLKKIPDNGITYSGSIQRWGSEYHVYGPTAIEGAIVAQ